MADKNRKRDKIFMDLKQLQYFVVCAQTGSFSDAAKNLYSTQPSVSKVIKGLEDTLGMQLFERLPRGIRLTVQGHKMYEYASKIINEVNVLENMASSVGRPFINKVFSENGNGYFKAESLSLIHI